MARRYAPRRASVVRPPAGRPVAWRPRPLIGALLGLASQLVGRDAAAQATAGGSRLALESGAAVLRQFAAPDLVAPTLSVDWRSTEGVRDPFRLGGTATIASNHRWAAQLLGGATHYVGRSGELAAQFSAVRFQSAPLTSQAQLLARKHAIWTHAERAIGLWLGASGGGTSRGWSAKPMIGVESGVWHSWRPEARIGFSVNALAAGIDTLLSRGAGLRMARGAHAFGAVDALASAEWRGTRLELAAYGGMRRSRHSWSAFDPSRVLPRYQSLSYAAATVWVAPTVGFVASAGEQYADPMRGVPAVRHVALAVRVRSRAPRRLDAPPPPRAPAATLAAPRLELTAAEGAAPRMHVVAPGATRVSLRADATNWRPVDLVQRADGRWELPQEVASGTHRVMIRIDDGEWITPANLPGVDDEFGSRVGLLVVP